MYVRNLNGLADAPPTTLPPLNDTGGVPASVYTDTTGVTTNLPGAGLPAMIGGIDTNKAIIGAVIFIVLLLIINHKE